MENSIDKYVLVKRTDRTLIDLFWLGFVVYSASYTISMSELVDYIICQAFQSIGLVMLIPSAIGLIKLRIENIYLQVMFWLYIIWILFIVSRGFELNYTSIKLMLFDSWYGLLPYLVPFLILFPKKLYFYRRMLDAVLAISVIYVIYDFMFIGHLMNSDRNLLSQTIMDYFTGTLGLTVFFILFTYKYNSKAAIYFILAAVGILLLLALVRARRGTLLMSALALIFAYFLFIGHSKQKLSIIIFSFLAGTLVLIFGLAFVEIDNVGLFQLILERGFEDTRSGVEDCFYRDMGFKDWIIGRGMNGEYYCPGVDPDDLTGYRPVIETDFLQTILKGGVISLALFLLISVPALFKGLFQSKNLLSKAAGLWILHSILNMYPTAIMTFTMQYLLFWTAIAICYSKLIRNISDELLVKYFRNATKYSKGVLRFEKNNLRK